MKAAEKVATLEALLAKVQRNASAPRHAPILAQATPPKESRGAPGPDTASRAPAAPPSASREVRDSEVEFNFEPPSLPGQAHAKNTTATPKSPFAGAADASPKPPLAAVAADAGPKPRAAADVGPKPTFADAGTRPVAAAPAEATPKPPLTAAKSELAKPAPSSPSARPDGLRGFPSKPVTARAVPAAEPSKPATPRAVPAAEPSKPAIAESHFDDLEAPEETTIARQISELDFSDEATVTRAAFSEDLAKTLTQPEKDEAKAPAAKPLAQPSSAVATPAEARGNVAAKPQRLADLASTIVMAPKPAATQPEPSPKPAPVFVESSAAKAAQPAPAQAPAPAQPQAWSLDPIAERAPLAATPSPAQRRGPKATLMGVGIADMEALSRELDSKDDFPDTDMPAQGLPQEPLSRAPTTIEPDDSELLILSRRPAPATVAEPAPATLMLPEFSAPAPAPLPIEVQPGPPPMPRPSEAPLASTLASEGEGPRPVLVGAPPAAPSASPPLADNPWARDAREALTTKTPPKKGSSGSAWMFGLATAMLVGAAAFIYLRHNGLQDVLSPKPAPTGTSISVGPKPSSAPLAVTAPPPVPTHATPTSSATAPTNATAPSASASAAPSARMDGSAAPPAKDAGAPAAAASPNAPGTGAPVAAGDIATLAASEGFLIVVSSVDAGVYSNGKFVGSTNQPLKIPCGARYVRLATTSDPPKSSPAWISPGGSVIVACKGSTSATIEPGASAPASAPAPAAPQNAVYP